MGAQYMTDDNIDHGDVLAFRAPVKFYHTFDGLNANRFNLSYFWRPEV
jgi:hypothetical protein